MGRGRGQNCVGAREVGGGREGEEVTAKASNMTRSR